MDTIGIKRCQEKLLRRREEILNTMRHLEKESREVTGQGHFDWLDQASDENEIRLLDQLTDTYLWEVGRIDHALGRISAGSYGLCLACPQPIEKARLDAFPESEFCFGCQDMRESFQRV